MADPLANLLKQRWQTPETLDDNKVSIILGRLQLDGFMFKHDGAWGRWPVEYLQSVISHYYHIEALRSKNKPDSFENDALNKKLIALAWTKQEQVENKVIADDLAELYQLLG